MEEDKTTRSQEILLSYYIELVIYGVPVVITIDEDAIER